MGASRRRLLFRLSLVLGVFVVFFGALLYRDGRHGRHVAAERMLNHAADFDFTDPPCSPAGRPGTGEVRVAYLGAGGIVVEWGGHILATAPYFTRQPFGEVLLGGVRIDEAAVARGLAGVFPDRWSVLLAGHSHYDHLADLPAVIDHLSDAARVWTNRSGRHMLAWIPDAERRLGVLNDRVGNWVRPDIDGEPAPFRFMPIVSEHAPHLYGFHFAQGQVDRDWNELEGRKVRSMLDGQSTNFLVDLLDDDRVVFRIFLQDSASPREIGHPPGGLIAERPVDLAVLTVPPYWQVENYPEGILESTRAGFALLTHYEDFMRPLEDPLRFVTSLTDARLDRMLERVTTTMTGRLGPPPIEPLCGPRGRHWAMPLPGEWLSFDTPEAPVLTSRQP